MPRAAPRICTYPSCGQVVHGEPRCEAHRRLHTGTFGDKARGTRHERGYGTAWDRLRRRILARDHGICQPCMREGRVHAGTHVDHVVPKAEGGTDDDDNLQTICADRHRLKTQAEAERAKGRGRSDL